MCANSCRIGSYRQKKERNIKRGWRSCKNTPVHCSAFQQGPSLTAIPYVRQGIGGALIFNPVLLQLTVNPQVCSTTLSISLLY